MNNKRTPTQAKRRNWRTCWCMGSGFSHSVANPVGALLKQELHAHVPRGLQPVMDAYVQPNPVPARCSQFPQGT